MVLIKVTGVNTCRGLCQTSASREAGLFSSVPLRQVKPSGKAIVSKLEERTLRTTALQSHRASKQKLCLDSRQFSPSLGASPFFPHMLERTEGLWTNSWVQIKDLPCLSSVVLVNYLIFLSFEMGTILSSNRYLIKIRIMN